MYNIYSIVILILFDIPRFSVNDLHQIQVAAPSPSSRKSCNWNGGTWSSSLPLFHCNAHKDNVQVENLIVRPCVRACVRACVSACVLACVRPRVRPCIFAY